MKNHFDNLQIIVPDLSSREILDLGAGEGGFLIECARRGCRATGLELNPKKITSSHHEAATAGVEITMVAGKGETLPFEDDRFGFINASEVIEHVESPSDVLGEMYRVMKPGAAAYVSVHNRFGIYDTHFHVYFLGWMPRMLGEKYIGWLNKGKEYGTMPDLQRISEMHYYTYRRFKKIAKAFGFKVLDTREIKIIKRFGQIMGGLGAVFYKVFLRPWYFSSFHILLRK